jgi:hypothetical protein
MLKLIMILIFLVISSLSAQEKVEITPSQIDKAPTTLQPPPVVRLPENYEETVKSSSLNTMEQKINLIVGDAVRNNKVTIEQVNDFIFLQVIPNYAYFGEKGEEQLAIDLMEILNSGKISAPRGAQFMNVAYNEMRHMNLPFKKQLINSMILGKEKFYDSIDLTFFVNVNSVSNRIFNSLENIKDFETVYNSTEKYYRTRYNDSRFLYLIRVPNIIYEVIYTGDLLENVISKYIKESLFIAKLLKKYEPAIIKNKNLDFDGRYIKGKKILVDLWFVPENTKMENDSAAKIFEKIINSEKIEITGSQKDKE